MHVLTNSSRRPLGHPAGTALIVVLVAISMLALGAYTYSELMITEYRMSDIHARQTQARASAQSGVEYVAAVLSSTPSQVALYDNPGLFHVPLEERSGFTAFVPPGSAAATSDLDTMQFGVADESAKININALASSAIRARETVGRRMLLALPGMTQEIADAILDWIDSDDDARPFGAERVAYEGAPPRNGPIDTLEELLMVRGVTPELLFGEDTNRNGVLDGNEDDGELTLPADNADGKLNLGWSQYLTVHSVEGHQQRLPNQFGQPRINLNQENLATLYDELAVAFSEEVALFITAYRLDGPIDTGDVMPETNWNPLLGNRPPYSAVAAENAEATETPTDESEKETRGGLDLSRGSMITISSIYDLIGMEVITEINGESARLSSPWRPRPDQMREVLPQLLDLCTVGSKPIIGRVNVNEAPREVLAGVPNLSPELLEEILTAREDRFSDPELFATNGWILIRRLVNLQEMQILDRFLTVRGDAYRTQVVGHSDESGASSRIEAVVDVSAPVAKIVMQRDLVGLGPGFSRTTLPQFGTSP